MIVGSSPVVIISGGAPVAARRPDAVVGPVGGLERQPELGSRAYLPAQLDGRRTGTSQNGPVQMPSAGVVGVQAPHRVGGRRVKTRSLGVAVQHVS